MSTVYHGTKYSKVANLLSGKSSYFPGLYVTDSTLRAQLYADAQATGEVQTELRYADGSAVVELQTTDEINWRTRDDDHNSLDKCETAINSWQIVKVTVYLSEYRIANSAIRVNGTYVNAVQFLTEQLGDKLEIVQI